MMTLPDAQATLWVVAVPLLFFASAIMTYIIHGLLRDTDNQLQCSVAAICPAS